MRARKSLGQHFLRQPALLARIAEASGAGKGDVVLEIGPGPGGLTEALLDRGCVVVAIERDERMAAALTRRLTGRDFVLVAGDALTLDWPTLLGPWTSLGRVPRVVGNIPYYITSPLLDKALTPPLPASVTFLVQQEVATRVTARPGTGNYGALSIGVQAVAEAEVVFPVGRAAFVPPPRVDSALLHLRPRELPLVPAERIPALRRLVVGIFSYRRKQMGRAMREAFGLSADRAERLLATAEIPADARPETIAPEGFVRLLEAFRPSGDGDDVAPGSGS